MGEDLFPMDVRGRRRPVNRGSQVLLLLLSIAIVMLMACAAKDMGKGRGGKVGTGSTVAVGDLAPDFTLEDAHGGMVTLSEIAGKGPTLIIFYLGYDCPHCMRHLRDLANRKAEVEKAGGQVIAISPDTVGATRAAIHDFGDFPFPMLSDPDKKAARAYGVLLGDDVMFHGAYVIDRERRVRFAVRSDRPYENTEGLVRGLEAAR